MLSSNTQISLFKYISNKYSHDEYFAHVKTNLGNQSSNFIFLNHYETLIEKPQTTIDSIFKNT